FWKADQSAFDVAYHAYPQIKNGNVVGGVITFMDITERREHEEKIRYLNEHDALTGLFNRRVLEHRLNEMDKPENWPLSVIFADINGLKLTNDIFGHAAGDELIQKSAQILAQSCREKDVVAHIGGDEFVILLPSTSKANAHKLLERIRDGFAGARVAAVKCSISLGVETKTDSDLSLAEILANAENEMYKDKTLNRQTVQQDAIDTIVETLHGRSKREGDHSRSVSELCARLGRALRLNEPQIKTLERAGYLHDIGKIAFDDKAVTGERLDEDEMEAMQQHAIVGYRILNLFDETLDLSEYVYSHHERWDGKGYPRGLKGEQIPLLSRIVAIAETYDRVLHRGDLPLEQRREQALGVIRNAAGTQFDPNIAAEFLTMMAEG
ncbi:MAG: diguanylate cyclase, partial [Eubacteriales bacterium]|nr:diguanylate cyclase [Eubacteriales bacterium]